MSLQKLQAVLDEHKADVGDGAYLSLCNSLKELHDSTEGFYVVQYYEYFQVQPTGGCQR
eukprot:COSAG05_NODE_21775_length_269_cov_0.900000_1_plen_58_part_01